MIEVASLSIHTTTGASSNAPTTFEFEDSRTIVAITTATTVFQNSALPGLSGMKSIKASIRVVRAIIS